MSKFFMVLGIIFMVLSGGCTLLFLADLGAAPSMLPIILIIGGIPFAIGLAMFLIARNALKKKTQDNKSKTVDRTD